jgi:hypothetical protein
MSVYLYRTHEGTLSSGMADADDTLFANQRFERSAGRLEGVRFSQCTFANISFKDADVVDCHFSGCVFERCYFRGTTIRESHFPATRFIDCEFHKPSILDSGFGFARFDRTFIPYAYLEPSFPAQANVCRDLAGALAVQAAAGGQEREARKYRLKSIKEGERALWRGARWTDAYAKSHFSTDLQRIGAVVRLVGSKTNGLLWGYGELVWRLLATWLVLAGLLFPLIYVVLREHLHAPGGVTVGECWLLSFGAILNDPGTSGVASTGVGSVAVLLETAIGLLIFGLFVTYVFRWVTRR